MTHFPGERRGLSPPWGRTAGINPVARQAVLFCLLIGLAVVGNPAQAEPPTNRSIYQQLIRSTAWVRIGKATGTGWLLDRDSRLLITAAHLPGKEKNVNVHFPQFRDGKLIAERSFYETQAKPITGKVIYRDGRRNLAAVQLDEVPAGIAELKLAAEPTAATETLHAVGNTSASQGLWAYHTGYVRQVNQRKGYVKGMPMDALVIVGQLAINDGDDGGPVVNDKGELVGVALTGVTSTQLVGLCVDVTEVREFAAKARQAAGGK